MDVKKILFEIKTAEDAGAYIQELLKDPYDPERKSTIDRFFELSPGMVCIKTTDGRFRKVSRSFMELTGYQEEELLSVPMSYFVVESDRTGPSNLHAFPFFNGSESFVSFENVYRCKDGTHKTLRWRCVRDPETAFVYASVEDITEDVETKKKLKEKTEQLQQLIEEKDKNLYYARNLQKVIMPYEDILSRYFNESFVFDLPREILSGNFCWMEKSGDRIFIAAADCTWHSVPGALMSIVCSGALTRAVKEYNITSTGQILDKVRELVSDVFKHSEIQPSDGMDISLCCINKQTCVIEWSGANNQLVFLHNGIVQELVGDKHSIGNYNDPMPFTTHKMYLSKGDNIYLFSDGYADQFGGDIGKKMLYRKFQSLLIKLAPLGMKQQKDKLQKEFERWKGELEQADDVLVVGLRL